MIQEILDNLFGNIETVNKKENFSKYEINSLCDDLNVLKENLNQSNYDLLNVFLKKYNYKWTLYIEDYSYSISQDNFQPLEIDEQEELKGDIVFTIHKKGSEILIIDIDLFNDFIKNLNLENFLDILNSKKAPISLINQEFEIKIGNESELKKTSYLSKQSHYRNYSQFPFSPDYFYFEVPEKEINTPLIEIIQKAHLIYCLIYIFDISEINNDKIELLITGNKTLKYSIDIKDIDISLGQYYYEIYNWIYAEKTKIEDRIVLSRNIITSYLKDGSLKINKSVFNSILSSNQIYIKGNISKYFEVRNKIIEQIEQTISKVNQSLDTFFNNFQKSVFVFISFFLTVFIYKIVNKTNLGNIFNEETSIIGLSFIGLSFLFLIASFITYRYDKKRVGERYENIKTRYSDVLIKDDINKIINDDFEYKNEISFLEKRVNIYIILWVLTIIIFLLALFLSSEYLDTLKIFYFLKNPTSN